MLDDTIKKLHDSLVPYGLYLQQRKWVIPPSVAESEGQYFNFEPFILLVIVFSLSEFFKGFLETLGGNLADYLSAKKKEGIEPEQLDVSVLVTLLNKDIDVIQARQISDDELMVLTDDGLTRVETYLTTVGIPTYKAKKLVVDWHTEFSYLLNNLG